MSSPAMVSSSLRPGISVVMPAYNYARFLPEAIDSALAQNYPNLEIIVVDDGSTDDTAQVVARYGSRVRYIHQPNAGLPAARNTGIHAATHPFVAFLDADDVWLPGMLDRVMDTFRTLPAEFGLVASKCIRFGVPGTPLNNKRLDAELYGEIGVQDILLQSRFSPSSVVARREVFEECGCFDPTLRSSEDRDMWIRIAARRRLHLIGEALIKSRVHPNNMSKNADRMKNSMRTVINKAWRARLVSPWELCFWLRVRANFFFQTSLLLNFQGRKLAAVRDLLISILLWPVFANPHQLNEPALFRLRTLVRILLTQPESGRKNG